MSFIDHIKKHWVVTVLVALSVLIPATVGAVYLFKSLNTHNGLTSSQINCILKDSRGYMWFGTPAGLYRYDGYVFKAFQSNSQDGSSLPDSYIENIYEGLDGELWIQTPAGYSVYHPQTESFDRDMNAIYAKMNVKGEPQLVYIDKHKNLWMYVPQRGVFCYNMTQQLLYEYGYTDNSQGIPEGNISSFGECMEGVMVVYEDGRIRCLDVQHQQRTVWGNDMIAQQKIKHSKALKAFGDIRDNVWIYGSGTLMCFDKKSGTWDTSLEDKLGITNSDCTVCSMTGDNYGNVWIATDTYGLIRLNVNTHESESITPTDKSNNPVASNNIQSVYVDDTGLLWVGTAKHGICYYGPNIYKFDVDNIGDVTAICQDANGKSWYGTSDKGVIGYDGQMASRQVSSMAVTRDGSLWAGSTSNGLTRIKNGASTIYRANDSISTIIDNHINDLSSDKGGNLWIATSNGLQVYNPTMNTFSTYTKENGKLQSNDITSLFYTDDGNRMLIGSSEGLIIMQLSSHDMNYYTGNSTNLKTFTNNYITQVYYDSRQLVWVGTREGLNILNLSNDTLNYITEKNGLCNNSICGITEDRNNNIWVTTNNGVCRIVVQRNHEDGNYSYNLYNYNTSDGLQSNEFNNGSIMTTRQGQVLMGGMYGVNWVSNNSTTASKDLPSVMLTQLFIGDEEIQTGHSYDGRVPLPQALNETNKLILANSQNTFTIKFAAGNYNQCDGLQFIYWLEGNDKDWHNGDAMKHGVTFTNLGSGTYTLHVKAVNSEGGVSAQERTITIVVRNPWWLSLWAILLYLVIGAFAFYFWKIGFKKIMGVWSEKRNIVYILRRQSKEMKKASEELRQPIARMVSLITDLKNREVSFETKEDLNTLQYQIMQISTRLTDMRFQLENAEQNAIEEAAPQLDHKGNIILPDVVEEHTNNQEEEQENEPAIVQAPTMRYLVVLIDDNRDFINFMTEHLENVYTFVPYISIMRAASDLSDLKADLVICKQDMSEMTGSELCNTLKMNPRTEKTKFVLVTDNVLKPQEMQTLGITLAADDYMSKPFNLKEAVRRFNHLLGYIDDNTNILESDVTTTGKLENLNEGIEGQHTIINSSITKEAETKTPDKELMTEIYEEHPINQDSVTPTEEESSIDPNDTEDEAVANNRPQTISVVEDTSSTDNLPATETEEYTDDDGNKQEASSQANALQIIEEEQSHNDSLGYSMLNAVDKQLIYNVEQYVAHNMSRGNISLDNMAAAMGMGRVPLFHKIKAITHKTPAELVRDLRLKHAANLLIKTPMSVSDIAVELGFMTTENFIHQFKEKFGMLPLEYQIKNRL